MTFEEAMSAQAAFCERSGAPITARVCHAIGHALDASSVTGARVLGWSGEYVADAVPLRLVAPFHALHRAGRCAALGALFRGEATDDVAAIRAAVTAHDDWIVRWLDGPPQTNEPGRSTAFMVALLRLAERFALPFELLEIGSSAGLNLLIDRYAYDLGGVTREAPQSSVTLAPEWRGPPPADAEVRIVSVRGVDIAPIDVRDPAAAERLLAYVWVDAPERIARVEAAVAMITEQPVDLVPGDAADWVEARLAEPQADGTCRVLMHSVVWPYLEAERRRRIEAAFEQAARTATLAKPIAWVAYEWGAEHANHRIALRMAPGGEEELLGEGHPHGAWIEAR